MYDLLRQDMSTKDGALKTFLNASSGPLELKTTAYLFSHENAFTQNSCWKDLYLEKIGFSWIKKKQF